MPPAPLRIYVYHGCDSCKKALRFLDGHGLAYEAVPIREVPPTVPELQLMLQQTGSLRRLFNTSGADYKTMNLAALLPGLTESEALDLLSRHGNLVKRPFLLTGDGRGTTGFKEAEWQELLPSPDS